MAYKCLVLTQIRQVEAYGDDPFYPPVEVLDVFQCSMFWLPVLLIRNRG